MSMSRTTQPFPERKAARPSGRLAGPEKRCRALGASVDGRASTWARGTSTTGRWGATCSPEGVPGREGSGCHLDLEPLPRPFGGDAGLFDLSPSLHWYAGWLPLHVQQTCLRWHTAWFWHLPSL